MITSGPRNTAIPIGRSATFSCNVSAEPTPTIVWRFNGIDLVDDGSKYTITRSDVTMNTQSVLTVNNLEVGDNGGYSCYVENEHGNETSTANLIVQSEFIYTHYATTS